jgi:AcrR family transcriptional regulator
MAAASSSLSPASPRPNATQADLLGAARRRFVAGDRLDIQGLAAELGISRATAYRWAGGNADTLAARVIAALAGETFKRCLREAGGTGWARIQEVQSRGLRYMSTFPPYRAFLQREREKALPIVASKEGSAQQTMIRLNQSLLEEEAERGNIELPVDAHTLAYAIVRISESFLYADLIAGEEPDVEKAMEILKLLCR